MILFETTESVIEILWDVALAIFITRLALVYFALNFLSALALSYLALSGRTPAAHLVSLQSPDVLLPFLLGSAALWARLMVVKWEVPRSAAFRLWIGVVALVFMVMAEGAVAWVGWEEGWWTGAEMKEGWVWAVLGGWGVWYAGMPAAMMFFERKERREEEVREEVREKS